MGDSSYNETMKTKSLIIVLLITLVLITACGAQPDSVIEPNTPDTPIQTPEKSEPVPVTEESLPPIETAGPDCLGDEISPIGQSIADDYKIINYKQVMTWFCNGAEFEDILVALETAEQTDTTADEMLQMLAEGFTWEEIWQLVGLTD